MDAIVGTDPGCVELESELDHLVRDGEERREHRVGGTGHSPEAFVLRGELEMNRLLDDGGRRDAGRSTFDDGVEQPDAGLRVSGSGPHQRIDDDIRVNEENRGFLA